MSTPKKTPIKPRGKQHDARAASFKRIARSFRQLAKARKAGEQHTAALLLTDIAHALDAEVTLLRSMR